ncbi:MAG: hypothetical protein EB015_07515 [Methylocystaceae bacterium]|nr:hypothetical protein [Methylocystaceae bacterium]
MILANLRVMRLLIYHLSALLKVPIDHWQALLALHLDICIGKADMRLIKPFIGFSCLRDVTLFVP